MLLDVLILVVLLVAVYVGYQRGLLPPLLSEVFFVFGLLLFLAGPLRVLPDLVTHVGLVHVVVGIVLALVLGYLGGRVGRRLQRMPVVRGVDGFFGVFVHAGVAVAILYVLISALVAMDEAFTPLINAASVSARAATQLQQSLAANPLTATFLDRETSQLARDSHSRAGAFMTNYPQLNQVQNVYLTFVRPQLHSSHLAPLILRLGSHIPILRHLGTGSIPPTK